MADGPTQFIVAPMSFEDFDKPLSETDGLAGHMLVAMPGIGDSRFERSVIYLCGHSEDGAMGLIVNKPVENVSFPELLEQLGIETELEKQIRVLFGGPVETGRGFVLHSADYHATGSTLQVTQDIGLTATLEILEEIAIGEGPAQSLLALGYAGWAPGQLEEEILANGWLHCKPSPDLLFGPSNDTKWERALAELGIDPAQLSGDAGTA